MFEILVVIVLLNIAATITLWRIAARRPEKLKKRFLDLFWRGEPIIPKHQPPPAPKKGDWAVSEEDLQFFHDFEDFADVVNWWLANTHISRSSPWRLQELPKSELSNLGADDSPSYGRRYSVFHNQVRCGEVEVMAGWEYSTENPHVVVHIELDWVRLLHFETIRGFLGVIAMHISEYRPGAVEQLQTDQHIDRAIMDVLWKTQEISKYGMENEPSHGEVEVQLDGLASFYLNRRQAFLSQVAQVRG